MTKMIVGGRVFTPLGRGKIVYQMPNSTLVVELESGSGHIFYPEELFQNISWSPHLDLKRDRRVTRGGEE